MEVVAGSSQQSQQQQQQKQQEQHYEQKTIPPSVTPSSSGDRGKQVLKVLHLTDPHFDPDYRVGANAICDAPLCCNPDSGEAAFLSGEIYAQGLCLYVSVNSACYLAKYL